MMANFAVQEVLGVAFTLLCCFTALVCTGDKTSEDPVKVFQFDVKPGGQTHVQEGTLDEVTCKFTYAAQGGTHENWSFGISRSSDHNHYVCTVERPGGNSYLYFLNFKMELKGGKVWDGEAYGNKERLLSSDESKVHNESNQISNQSGFKNELSKVSIYANTAKTEL